jgi:phosphoglycolate phosphatase
MLIIFDLDGTLLNTIDDLAHACNHALMQSGFPTHAIEEYPALVGNGVKNLIRRALPDNERTEENVERVYTAFVPYYDAHNADYTRPYEGIVELLQNLKQAGHTLAVASNKYQAATEKIVNQLFPSIFDVILGEREGIARKPDPQIVYDILSTLSPIASKLSPSLYVGDSLVDAATAKAAKLPFIACTWGFCTEEQLLTANPDYLVHHPSDILNTLLF